ncbi:MAG: InlB B-repeat-containing protein [Oscillospiraceae bacterium]|nr:InlB B-repeat-containing protein [Oscillospiraceae bacterium]
MKKYLKKILTAAMMAVLTAAMLCTTAFAADDSRQYQLDLTVNGQHEVHAKTGDILNVVLTLRRTDNDSGYTMYAMQDEIRYDPQFFEIIQNNSLTAGGISITDIGLIDDYRAFYVNFLSLSGGENWNSEVVLGSFQVKVTGTKGSAHLKNENCIISTPDGSDSYAVEVNDLLVVVTSDCTVEFDSMGGSDVEKQTVTFGELITKPQDPTREGYTFDGWYKDIYLKEKWNFDTDTVTGNMVLYAGWTTPVTAPVDDGGFPWWKVAAAVLIGILLLIILLFTGKRVTYMLDDTTEYLSEKIKKDKPFAPPRIPQKAGAQFDGWYRDKNLTLPWDFEHDTTDKSIKLYAKWK